jgi:hypothetical protein
MLKLKYRLVLLLALVLPVRAAMATIGLSCHDSTSRQVQPSRDTVSPDLHPARAAAGPCDSLRLP